MLYCHLDFRTYGGTALESIALATRTKFDINGVFMLLMLSLA